MIILGKYIDDKLYNSLISFIRYENNIVQSDSINIIDIQEDTPEIYYVINYTHNIYNYVNNIYNLTSCTRKIKVINKNGLKNFERKKKLIKLKNER